MAYPDAEVRTVPQWELVADKKFTLIADVGPGELCPLPTQRP